ncbi:hypothetical protein C8F04DRAFT_1105326 [Mycena alexandri]|uniref:C2H2-type domain-containing protein n=1 Tax=Mycena alexandri TaxID=1745969 RepID=A0AAD6ST33_9AGAR|nr:hypothetical protein C8F04DRAFT_1105326 [Mycena alexandri]
MFNQPHLAASTRGSQFFSARRNAREKSLFSSYFRFHSPPPGTNFMELSIHHMRDCLEAAIKRIFVFLLLPLSSVVSDLSKRSNYSTVTAPRSFGWTYKCTQCPEKVFNSRSALFQHYRQAAQHPFCAQCQKYCHDNAGLDAHNAIAHPEFKCTLCKGKPFLTQSSLEDHYRGKPAAIHPNCDRCGKGFFSKRILDDHVSADHPKTKCCGRTIFDDDLPEHYRESVHHPKCDTCGIGFKGDEAYNTHAAVAHADLHCVVCRRQFTTREDLEGHFKTSNVHPQCEQCSVGFLDDAALNEHLAAEHAVTPRLQIALSPGPINPSLHPTHHHQDFLAIEDVPGAPRLDTRPLPPPGDEVQHLWTSTANQIVPNPFEVASFNKVMPVMNHHWKTSRDVYCKSGSGRNSVGCEMPSSRLLRLATEGLKSPDAVSRRQITLDETPTKVPQVDRLKSWTSLSKQSLSESTPRVSANGSNTSTKTISPQSSSSSLHSGSASFAELSESSSGSGLGMQWPISRGCS